MYIRRYCERENIFLLIFFWFFFNKSPCTSIFTNDSFEIRCDFVVTGGKNRGKKTSTRSITRTAAITVLNALNIYFSYINAKVWRDFHIQFFCFSEFNFVYTLFKTTVFEFVSSVRFYQGKIE